MVVCGNVCHVQTAAWLPFVLRCCEVMRLFSTDVMKYSRNRHASLASGL